MPPHTVQGPTPQTAFRKPASNGAAAARARHFNLDENARRRFESRDVYPPALRAQREGGRVRSDSGRTAPRTGGLWNAFERNLLQISAVLFFIGSLGWCWLIFSQFRSPVIVEPAEASFETAKADARIIKSDSSGTSIYVRIDRPLAARVPDIGAAEGESAASVVAREWSAFAALRLAEQIRALTKQAAKEPDVKPPVRTAALESGAPQLAPARTTIASVPPGVPANVGAATSLVDFETAPFPYHGLIPGSNRPFLNVSQEGQLGHATFRGRILWEAQTFSDDRVLLHIPPGFDSKRPAVMVVFFHGHGADLARDVRDRQRVPAQITAAGANAVLVAPQFAFDAADSSAGKFWEPDGFKRFLAEAATKLAKLYGTPRSAAAFARMPIVIVAYSGGFGPTLAVLEHGTAGSRLRGIILLDALYSGIDKFADWIANNRSAFFVSAYTPHTASHNEALERLLSERSVPYGFELRPNHIQGMVTFLPAGDISHRDFVTRAWTDNPVADILARMEDVDPDAQKAGTTASIRPAAASRN